MNDIQATNDEFPPFLLTNYHKIYKEFESSAKNFENYDMGQLNRFRCMNDCYKNSISDFLEPDTYKSPVMSHAGGSRDSGSTQKKNN